MDLKSKYRVLCPVGHGGICEQFHAENLETSTKVIIKRPIGRPKSLLNEYDILQEFNHPNIIKVFEKMEWEGEFCFVMEFLVGTPLRGIYQQYSPSLTSFIAGIFLQIYDAINYIHEMGYIYANLYPVNIVVLTDGKVKLIDFELCIKKNESRGEGVIAGTPPYMAPEQWRGQNLFESDYFALGTMVWEYLRGSNPFKNSDSGGMQGIYDTIMNIDKKKIFHEIQNKELASIISELLDREPGIRRPAWGKLKEFLESNSSVLVTDVGVVHKAGTSNQKDITSKSRKIRVLAVFANPRETDPLRLSEENRVIKEAIQISKYRDNIELTFLHAATIHDLRRGLLNGHYEIVHISSHGSNHGLYLEDEIGQKYLVPQEGLAGLLQGYSEPNGSVRCALLNSCYSLEQGNLISLGVQYTIAMEGAVGDRAAIEFARGFYDAIGAGRDIEFCFQEGCRCVRLSAYASEFSAKLITKTEIGSISYRNEVKAIDSWNIEEATEKSKTIKLESRQKGKQKKRWYRSLKKMVFLIGLLDIIKSTVQTIWVWLLKLFGGSQIVAGLTATGLGVGTIIVAIVGVQEVRQHWPTSPATPQSVSPPDLKVWTLSDLALAETEDMEGTDRHGASDNNLPPKPRLVADVLMKHDLISAPDPQLPDVVKAQRRGQAVTGLYKVCVAQDGSVSSVSVMSGIPGADESIMATLRKWRYKLQTIEICFLQGFEFHVE